ncbi:hypothetical protein EDD15DRAFT_1486070 [Pisolithus albus]|nr:hypothetical protein EDD15DRAFT_1486070 [Pisolithus albus]
MTGRSLVRGKQCSLMDWVYLAICADAACSTSNNCAVQFAFTGSGITIYVLQAGPQGMSASLSIDSGTATTATLAAPPAPQYNIPNVVLFDVQNMVSGNHTAVMTVLDWDGGFSGMMLDYIDVNEAVVAGTTPTTSAANQTPTPTTTQASSNPSGTTSQSSQSTTTPSNQTSSSTAASPVVASSQVNSTSTSASIGTTSSSSSGDINSATSSSSKKIDVGAVAGGAAAGAVGLLALCALAIFCFRRRKSRSSTGNTTPLLRPPESGFLAGSAVDPFARAPTVPSDGFNSAGDPSGASIGGVDATTTRDLSTQPSSIPVSTPTSLSPQVGGTAQGSVPDINPSPAGVSASPLRQLPAIPISPSLPSTRATENAQSSMQGSSRETWQVGGVVPNSQSARQPILTDEQADFVTSLYQNNVPAPVVARVLERMLANPNPSPSGSSPSAAIGPHDPELRAYMPASAPGHRRILSWLGSQLGDAESTAPPSYDHAQTHS